MCLKVALLFAPVLLLSILETPDLLDTQISFEFTEDSQGSNSLGQRALLKQEVRGEW